MYEYCGEKLHVEHFWELEVKKGLKSDRNEAIYLLQFTAIP